ncbi:hypothetical protein BGP_6268 [Beggiatoa sp. PS]|nr:hypothetical protein BGP_6268 [Beggiatoa sp. PS]
MMKKADINIFRKYLTDEFTSKYQKLKNHEKKKK